MRMKVYDISQEVFGCAVYPGDPKPERKIVLKMSEGAVCNLSAFSMCAHNGTHVDAPLHFYADGKSIDRIDPECFVGYAYVAAHEGLLLAADADKADAMATRALLGPEDAPMEVHLIMLGAEIVLLEGIRLAGVDEGAYLLHAAPLNLGGADGAPCRATLIRPD